MGKQNKIKQKQKQNPKLRKYTTNKQRKETEKNEKSFFFFFLMVTFRRRCRGQRCFRCSGGRRSWRAWRSTWKKKLRKKSINKWYKINSTRQIERKATLIWSQNNINVLFYYYYFLLLEVITYSISLLRRGGQLLAMITSLLLPLRRVLFKLIIIIIIFSCWKQFMRKRQVDFVSFFSLKINKLWVTGGSPCSRGSTFQTWRQAIIYLFIHVS